MSYHKESSKEVRVDIVKEPFTAEDVVLMFRKMRYAELERLAGFLLCHGVSRPSTHRNLVDVFVAVSEASMDD